MEQMILHRSTTSNYNYLMLVVGMIFQKSGRDLGVRRRNLAFEAGNC